MLSKYTDTDQIRAVLGVSEDDLEDDVLNQEVFLTSLLFKLRMVGSNLLSAYDTINTKVVTTRTAEEQQLWESVRLFSTYAVARECLAGLPMFAPKSIEDSRTNVTRFSGAPYESVKREVEARYVEYRSALLAALAAYEGSSTTSLSAFPLLSGVGLSTDPVTG